MSSLKVVKDLKGAGKVYRATPGLLPPNSHDRSPVLAMVEHIPVIPQMKGTQDFITLANVLKQQGLSLEAATDGAGNVCIYNRLDVLCYQARGLNGPSCGVEHMHYSINDPWSRKQLRASAFLWHYAKVNYGLPYDRAKLRNAGHGVAAVVRKGHTTHRAVSAVAGYNDRSDPGPGYDFEYVRHAAKFFDRHEAFVIRRGGKTIGA